MLRYLLILLSLLWTTTLFATPSIVGKIEDLACASNHYSLKRQGESLPVKLFMELQAGDVLTFKPTPEKECRTEIQPGTPLLSISLNGQPNEVIKYQPELTYTVPQTTTMATARSNFLTQISSWLTKQHDQQIRTLVSLVGRTDNQPLRPRIEVLKGNKQQLVAGERALFIAWQWKRIV